MTPPLVDDDAAPAAACCCCHWRRPAARCSEPGRHLELALPLDAAAADSPKVQLLAVDALSVHSGFTPRPSGRSIHDALSHVDVEPSSVASGNSIAGFVALPTREEPRRLSTPSEFFLSATHARSLAEEAAACGVSDVDKELQSLLSEVATEIEDYSVDPFWKHSKQHFGLRCLRARDFNRAAALRLLVRFAHFRKRVGWPYSVRLVGSGGQQVLEALLSGVHWLLPSPDADGRSVVVLRPALIQGPVEPYHRMGCFVMQWATGLVSAGPADARYLPSADMYITMIVDLSGVGLRHRSGPADMERGIRMWQDSFPLKLRAIYLLNAGRLIGGLIGLAKTFISANLRERISTFSSTRPSGPGSLEDLRAKLGGRDSDIPREWGGTLDFSASDNAADTSSGWASTVYAELARARQARDASLCRQNVSGFDDRCGAYEWWEDWVDRTDQA